MTPKNALGSLKPTCMHPSRCISRLYVDKFRQGAIDVMKEYFEEIGGRPEPKGQKRKGRHSGVKPESGTLASLPKRIKQEKQWSPPPGSWEHEVSHIDTVEESMAPKTGQRQLFAYLVWNNQKKTQHPLRHVYQKCPQKVHFPSVTMSGLRLIRCRCFYTTRVT